MSSDYRQLIVEKFKETTGLTWEMSKKNVISVCYQSGDQQLRLYHTMRFSRFDADPDGYIADVVAGFREKGFTLNNSPAERTVVSDESPISQNEQALQRYREATVSGESWNKSLTEQEIIDGLRLHLGEYDDITRLFFRDIDKGYSDVPLRAISPAYPIRELSIVAERSMEKPPEFVAMLRALADQIEQIDEVERARRPNGRTPFLIDAVSANLRDGVLTVYYRGND